MSTVWRNHEFKRISRVSAILALTVALQTFAGAQPSLEWTQCVNANREFSPDIAIGGCTTAIQSSKDSKIDSAIAYHNRGFAYAIKKDYDSAIADYDQAIQLNPNLAMAFNNRGNAYYEKKDYEHAIADYSDAIRIDPALSNAYHNRGWTHYFKGDNDHVISDYSEAIRINPNYKLAFVNRGRAQAKKGDQDRAIADYNEALKIDPKYAFALFNRGQSHRQKHDYDLAIADYTEVINIDPKHANAYYNRGLSLENRKDFQRALADFQRFTELSPTDPDGPKVLERITKAISSARTDEIMSFVGLTAFVLATIFIFGALVYYIFRMLAKGTVTVVIPYNWKFIFGEGPYVIERKAQPYLFWSLFVFCAAILWGVIASMVLPMLSGAQQLIASAN